MEKEKFKGTKGKWKATLRNPTFVEIRSVDSPEKPIAELESYYHGKVVTGYEELKANSQLISCAPEMLEMLMVCEEAMSELMEHQDGWGEDYHNLKKLIKQATEI